MVIIVPEVHSMYSDIADKYIHKQSVHITDGVSFS